MSFLLYGANGYTGELVARTAVEQGLRPLLAGRNREAVAALAGELGLDHRVFALDERSALEAALNEVGFVLNCAGPFAETARPLVDSCMRTGRHYLDITGEAPVFEALAHHDRAAQQAGIMLLPGAGFDVVPSDCLALYLKQQLPAATRLTLAIMALSQVSRGTATTALQILQQGGLVRRDGVLTRVPPAHAVRQVDFGRGPRTVVAIPWGDVATAYYSTGIPNIEVYAWLPGIASNLVRSGLPTRLLTSYAGRRILTWLVRRGAPGPDAARRAAGQSIVWGEVTDDAGQRRVARLRTPEGYTLTVATALHISRKVLAATAPAGFQTPASAYGADLIMQIEGVSREDVESS